MQDKLFMINFKMTEIWFVPYSTNFVDVHKCNVNFNKITLCVHDCYLLQNFFCCKICDIFCMYFQFPHFHEI